MEISQSVSPHFILYHTPSAASGCLGVSATGGVGTVSAGSGFACSTGGTVSFGGAGGVAGWITAGGSGFAWERGVSVLQDLDKRRPIATRAITAMSRKIQRRGDRFL